VRNGFSPQHSSLRTLLQGATTIASAPEAITEELPELYQDFERLHPVPLREIAPRLLPREPQAIPYQRRALLLENRGFLRRPIVGLA
jgi:hypothetical protein